MNIETRKICDLHPADYNPRKKLTPADAEYQKIARSIDEFGYVDPIIINSDNTIIGGHQRAAVLFDKGFNEVQVVVLNLSKDKEKALNIALNKISGEWDMEKLNSLLQELEAENYDLSITGFDEKEINDIMNEFCDDTSAEDDNFDADAEYENIEQPISQLGDIWLLGNHRLMCGDSCNADDVVKLMNGVKSQLIVTDPPYNVNYGDKAAKLEEYNKGHRNTNKILNDNMSDAAFYSFLLDAFTNMYNCSEPGAAIYVFHADTEGINFRTAFSASGFMLKQCLIWVKNTLVLGRQDYQWKHEPILYGWKDGAAHYFIDDRTQTTVIDTSSFPNFKKMKKDELLIFITDYFNNLDKTPQSVIYCDKPTKSEDHPTMKPIPLCGQLIKNSSKPDWIVSDFFGGSGSTLVACERLDRKAYLMELDPKYVDVIVKRYIKLTGNEMVTCLRSEKKYMLSELTE